jgi:ribose transport system substrate-binding protein
MLKNMHYKGSILELAYNAGAVCYGRDQIFKNLVAKYPAIKVTTETVPIPGYTAAGDEDATAWLASHPASSGPLGIWGCWDDPSVGASAAVVAAHRTIGTASTDVQIYGMDGDPTALGALLDHHMTATIWENGYAEGQELVRLLAQHAQAVKAGKSWKTMIVNVAGIMVTQSNIKSFIKTHTGVMG